MCLKSDSRLSSGKNLNHLERAISTKTPKMYLLHRFMIDGDICINSFILATNTRVTGTAEEVTPRQHHNND